MRQPPTLIVSPWSCPAAIQQRYIEDAQSPLEIARKCRDILVLGQRIVGKSNPNTLSDLGVASQQAYAGLEGAIMNVKINIPSLKDEKFKSEASSEAATLLDEGRKAKDNVYQYVSGQLGWRGRRRGSH